MLERWKSFLFGCLLIGAALVAVNHVSQSNQTSFQHKLRQQSRRLFNDDQALAKLEEGVYGDADSMAAAATKPAAKAAPAKAAPAKADPKAAPAKADPKAAAAAAAAAAAKPVAATPKAAVAADPPADPDAVVAIDPKAAVRDNYSCTPANGLAWEGRDGYVILQGHPVFLKGITWSGVETLRGALQGIQVPWDNDATATHTIDQVLQDIKYAGFNAIRVPVSLNFALAATDEEWYALADLIDAAAYKGVLVSLVMKSLDRVGAPEDPADVKGLWYNSRYTEADFIAGWERLLKYFANRWNLFAIDILDEPGATATWGATTALTDFNQFAYRFIAQVSYDIPEYTGLFVVQGLAGSCE